MTQKITLLRQLIDDVGLVNHAQIATRWGISREGVRRFFDHAEAPTPVFEGTTRLYALPEVEAFRSRRVLARRRGADG